MFNVYAVYTDENGLWDKLVGSFNSQIEAELFAEDFEDNMGYCGNFARMNVKCMADVLE